MDAFLGHDPSYSLRSIWSSIPILKEGLRWRVGSGDFSVCGEKWMQNDNALICLDQSLHSLATLRVRDLWIQGQKQWNSNLVNMIFSPYDARQIMDTPLYPSVNSDRRVWSLSSTGIYTVKTAYHMAIDTLINRDHLNVDGEWSRLCKLDVPPRVKLFLWKVCMGCLPTHCKLQTKVVQCPSLCVMCDSNLENLWHLFFSCESSIEC